MELMIVENLKPVEVYNSGNIDKILEKIAEDARAQKIDISTEKGRKDVASLAYKIAQSKTFLDKMGKSLGDDARKQIDTLNAERKKCTEFLDSLKEEIRAPLTEWELKEKRRVSNHESQLLAIESNANSAKNMWRTIGSQTLKNMLIEVTSVSRDWEEFHLKAKETIQAAVGEIQNAIQLAEQAEDDQRELERLRAEKAEREKKEHEDKIAREAAAKAKYEAEEKARLEAAEREKEAEVKAAAIEHEKQMALKKAKDAEEAAALEIKLAEKRAKEAEEKAKNEKLLADKRAKEAAELAEKEKKAAVENERKRLEAEKSKLLEEERLREANKKHVAKINNTILASLKENGIEESQAKQFITLVALGKIPHVKVNY